MAGRIVQIFITTSGGMIMQPVEEVEAVADCGLRGDRYCSGTGRWAGSDACQVTLIEEEVLEKIAHEAGLQVAHGEHRRNIVVRGIRLEASFGKQMQIGEASLYSDKPRPPCRYLESLTEPGMMQQLTGQPGICARVVKSGMIRTRDEVIIL